MNPPLALSAEHLEKKLGGVPIVNGINLQVAPGEVVGLLGPNGAGKTTLLHLCAGLLSPDRGAIDIAGRGNPTTAKNRHLLGFAPQSTALYEELTVEENLDFFGRIYGLQGQALQDAIDAGLAISRLINRKHDRTGNLSGGMKRRLHVACAIVHNPKLLMLDEPTVGVDPDSRAHILSCVARLRENGMGVVYASHHLDEVEKLCDRVVFIAEGRVVQTTTKFTASALENTLFSLPRGQA